MRARAAAEPRGAAEVFAAMQLTDLRMLNNRIVLVKSARDHRNPPISRRGTIRVHEDPADRGNPLVQIALEFPQMFSTKAHRHTITLAPADVDRLLLSENNGAFELTLDEPLDPAAPGVGQ